MSTYEPIKTWSRQSWQDRAALFVSDLDRCEHGRHMGDACGNCPGYVSNGNPRQRGKDPRTRDGEQILGFDIGAYPYVMTALEDYERTGPVIELRDER